MLLITATIFFTTIILYIFYVTFFNRNPPGPWNLPFLGYLPWINSEKPYETLTDLSRKYGPVYGLWMGSIYTVVISDPKIIRKVLIKDVFSGRAPLLLTHGLMFGFGIICVEGDLWKDQRKFLHTFLRNIGAAKSSSNKTKLENTIKAGVNELLQTLDAGHTTNLTIDILPPLRHCLGNIINSFVFGHTWQSDDAEWKWLQLLQEEGTKLIGIGGPVNYLPMLRFLPMYRRTIDFLLDGKVKTHQVYQSLIYERQKLIEENSDPDCRNLIDAFLVEKRKRHSLNEDSKSFYNNQQFYHLLADVFGASLDTTLTALRWFFLFMSAYPHEQTKLQEELDTVLNGKLPSIDDLPALPFTEAALAETQRIRSVLPLGIPHGTLDDTVIEGFDIPKGTMIIPLQWAIHMDSKNWTNPEVYNPSRFIDSEGKFSSTDYFIPFQTGKRVCIGEDLARMLLFLFGASVVQKFQISCPVNTDTDLKGECGITLTPKNHLLVFTPRIIKNNEL